MICTAVQRLIEYGIRTALITKDDEYVVRNGLMDVLGLTDWQDGEISGEISAIDDILAPIVDYACEQGIIPDTSSSRDLFDTKIMGLLTPMPREIIAEFRRRYEKNPVEATDWYYRCSLDLNYVRAGRIAKDLR